MIPALEKELRELAERCVLAADLSGRDDKFAAQGLFCALPHEHILLRDHFLRLEFQLMIRQARITIDKQKTLR